MKVIAIIFSVIGGISVLAQSTRPGVVGNVGVEAFERVDHEASVIGMEGLGDSIRRNVMMELSRLDGVKGIEWPSPVPAECDVWIRGSYVFDPVNLKISGEVVGIAGEVFARLSVSGLQRDLFQLEDEIARQAVEVILRLRGLPTTRPAEAVVEPVVPVLPENPEVMGQEKTMPVRPYDEEMGPIPGGAVMPTDPYQRRTQIPGVSPEPKKGKATPAQYGPNTMRPTSDGPPSVLATNRPLRTRRPPPVYPNRAQEPSHAVAPLRNYISPPPINNATGPVNTAKPPANTNKPG